MIPVVVVVLFLLCFVLIHRHHLREHRRELFVMKRHAAEYQEVHKSPW
jgi:hypothetical protein